jgi:hypothetical protein
MQWCRWSEHNMPQLDPHQSPALCTKTQAPPSPPTMITCSISDAWREEREGEGGEEQCMPLANAWVPCDLLKVIIPRWLERDNFGSIFHPPMCCCIVELRLVWKAIYATSTTSLLAYPPPPPSLSPHVPHSIARANQIRMVCKQTNKQTIRQSALCTNHRTNKR